MRRLFRPRNLLIMAIIGVIVGVVMSKKSSAPAPSYTDPWASPSPAETADGEATEATGTNGDGSGTTAESETSDA